MKFAADIAWILIVMRDSISALRVIFRGPLLQEKDAERERLHGFLKATVIEPLRIRIKHSYHYFMIYQYEYMGCVYQKNTGIDLAYHQAQKKIGLRWRFTLTHLIRKNTSVPPMSRCIG